jgi:flagellar biosynthesis/type III secretory pathway protein FliH
MTKKSKSEAERDLLAMNHKRLNKAISDLLAENKALRKRVEASIVEINNLREKIADKTAEDQISLMHTVVHSLSGRLELTSPQVAERAVLISREVIKKMSSNDNRG